MEKWIKAVPISKSHGSGPLQKKLWRLTSDCVRIRDWLKYNKCAATGKIIPHWSMGQAGHYKAYSKCNGMAKFDTDNIFLQSYVSNGFGDHEDWKVFEAEIRSRGYDPDAFERKNRDTPLKFTTQEVIDKMKERIEELETFPEQYRPDYYKRIKSLL